MGPQYRAWWSRVLCRLNGHDLLPSFQPGRICLRCVSCSYETPGWLLKERPQGSGRPASTSVLVEQNVLERAANFERRTA